MQVTGPADATAVIDRLRTDGTVITYYPDNRFLRAGNAPSVTIGRDTTDTRPRRNRELSAECVAGGLLTRHSRVTVSIERHDWWILPTAFIIVCCSS